MSTDDYDDSEGPHDDDTWRMLCIVGVAFVVATIGLIIASLLGAF